MRNIFTTACRVLFLVICSASHVTADDNSEYVGRSVCVTCHQQQTERWRGSHHDLAMQHVDEKTVLGDFSDAEFSYAGVMSAFYKNNNKFMVRTEGPEGKLQD